MSLQHKWHYFLWTTAGWKLTPMVGAMYSPELYTGMTSKITVILISTRQDEYSSRSSAILSISTWLPVPRGSRGRCHHRRDHSRSSPPGSRTARLQCSQGSCPSACHPYLPRVKTLTKCHWLLHIDVSDAVHVFTYLNSWLCMLCVWKYFHLHLEIDRVLSWNTISLYLMRYWSAFVYK